MDVFRGPWVLYNTIYFGHNPNIFVYVRDYLDEHFITVLPCSSCVHLFFHLQWIVLRGYILSAAIKWEKRWTRLIKGMFKPNEVQMIFKSCFSKTQWFRYWKWRQVGHHTTVGVYIFQIGKMCAFESMMHIHTASADFISAKHRPWSCLINVINSRFVGLWFCLYLPSQLGCLCSCARVIIIKNIYLFYVCTLLRTIRINMFKLKSMVLFAYLFFPF